MFFLQSEVLFLTGVLQPSWVSHSCLCFSMEVSGFVAVSSGKFSFRHYSFLSTSPCPALRPLDIRAGPFCKAY